MKWQQSPWKCSKQWKCYFPLICRYFCCTSMFKWLCSTRSGIFSQKLADVATMTAQTLVNLTGGSNPQPQVAADANTVRWASVVRLKYFILNLIRGSRNIPETSLCFVVSLVTCMLSCKAMFWYSRTVLLWRTFSIKLTDQPRARDFERKQAPQQCATVGWSAGCRSSVEVKQLTLTPASLTLARTEWSRLVWFEKILRRSFLICLCVITNHASLFLPSREQLLSGTGSGLIRIPVVAFTSWRTCPMFPKIRPHHTRLYNNTLHKII